MRTPDPLAQHNAITFRWLSERMAAAPTPAAKAMSDAFAEQARIAEIGAGLSDALSPTPDEAEFR